MQTNSPASDVFRVGCKYVHRTPATSVFEVWCEICSCAHLCCFICCHLLPLWSSPSCCAALPCSGAHTRIKNRAMQKHVRFERIYHSGSDCCALLVPVMEFQRPLSQGAVKLCGKSLCQALQIQFQFAQSRFYQWGSLCHADRRFPMSMHGTGDSVSIIFRDCWAPGRILSFLWN